MPFSGALPWHGKPLDLSQHVAHIALSRKPRSMSDDKNDDEEETFYVYLSYIFFSAASAALELLRFR